MINQDKLYETHRKINPTLVGVEKNLVHPPQTYGRESVDEVGSANSGYRKVQKGKAPNISPG